jgi:hypothetical protein
VAATGIAERRFRFHLKCQAFTTTIVDGSMLRIWRKKSGNERDPKGSVESRGDMGRVFLDTPATPLTSHPVSQSLGSRLGCW